MAATTLLRLTLKSNGYWIPVQTTDGITQPFDADRGAIREFNTQSISPPRAGAANANSTKVTAIKAIALIANDQ
jgi:hypothetical protein